MRIHNNERVVTNNKVKEIVRIKLKNRMIQEYGRTFQIIFYRGENYNVSKYVL
jgi:hypothetical protein